MANLDNETRKTVLKRISELEGKALSRLRSLENSGRLTGGESAGDIMASITAELARGYDCSETVARLQAIPDGEG